MGAFRIRPGNISNDRFCTRCTKVEMVFFDTGLSGGLFPSDTLLMVTRQNCVR